MTWRLLTGSGAGVGPTGPQGAAGTVGPTGPSGPSDFTAPAVAHDTTHSPIGLWNFENNLNDSSGNGRNLSLTAGNAIYRQTWPGKISAFYFDGSSELNSSDAAFRLTGDVTVEFLLWQPFTASAVAYVSQQGTVASELSAQNALYVVGHNSGLFYVHEHTAGVDVIAVAGSGAGGVALIPPPILAHIAVVRDIAALTVTTYFDGVSLGAAAISQAPDGGGSSVLRIGGQNAVSRVPAGTMMTSVKIIAGKLTADQVRAERNRCVGALYGAI